MITIKVDLGDLTKSLNENIAEILEEKMTDIYVDLTAPPPLGTPVDTGQARNGWQLDASDKLNPVITNSVPYINRLNDGHSKQSPSGFIEAIIDKHCR